MDSSRAAQLAPLNEAIDALSADQLRYVVRKLCAKSETISKYLGKKLLPNESETVPEESETVSKYFSKKTPVPKALGTIDLTNDDEDEASAEEAAPPRKKQKHVQPRYETCEQCKEEYDAEDNGPTSCVWHYGDSKVDYEGDFWGEDEGCRWVDSDWAREEHPGGFIWDCCQQIGADTPGCQTGHHVPKPRE
ncbi:hypothetical protein RB598_000152 [Gaeumannomyces tritici]